jgi:uncharacterized membrane protein YfcA
MGVPVQGATGTSLAIVGLNAATGALDHLRRGRSLLRTGAAFGASGVFAALAGVWLNHRGVGFLTGFFGVGGGFLIVPALVLVLGLPMHLAVGTFTCGDQPQRIVGMIGNLQLGTLDWTLTLLFAAGGIVGLHVWTQHADAARA